MIWFKAMCVMVVINMSSCKTSSRVLEGYPLGYLSDCPGSDKEARISRTSLRQLAFMFLPGDDLATSIRNMTQYNYHRMKSLSKHLDFKKKTVLYVNGYSDSSYLTLTSIAMGSVYKRLGYNVLLLEYVAFSAFFYPKAVRLLRPVGKRTAEMLAELTKYGLDPKKLEIVGLSHGGQAISFIAKNYRNITGTNISRLTALDPAGPCFRHNGPDQRIDASDADFVEIVHTNMDGFGIASPVGHIDYYVNGGEYQHSIFEGAPCSNICSHSRSYQLWIGALLNPNSFIGIQCDSVQEARERNCFDRKPFVTNVIGLNVDKNKQGIFYVMSSNTFPFGMGRRGLEKKFEFLNTVIRKQNAQDIVEI